MSEQLFQGDKKDAQFFHFLIYCLQPFQEKKWRKRFTTVGLPLTLVRQKGREKRRNFRNSRRHDNLCGITTALLTLSKKLRVFFSMKMSNFSLICLLVYTLSNFVGVRSRLV